ncbi:hypothetical protein B4U79_16815 [Dinothrombium tinctorium]|uniref:Insulin-like domain-containing protein n=1 Tax=Dinothrombium tinctorium TaxID=1965070 RepID=A0A443QCP1_9ACAR|nr:hypothetical protein B4U79_16815 [Dinothrombium tinctorium]
MNSFSCAMLFTLALFASSLAGFTEASLFAFGNDGFVKRGSGFQACGKNLVNALAEICGHVYNKRPSARSAALNLGNLDKYFDQWEDDYLNEWLNKQLEEQSPSQLDLSPDSYTFERSIRSQGAVDLCCKRSCTIKTLKSFCGEKL